MLFRFWVFPDCTFLDISISSKSYRHNAVPDRFSSRFSTSLTNGPRSLSQTKASTHSASLKGSHTAAYTPKQGGVSDWVLSLPSERSARSRTSPGRVSERQTLPLLGLGWMYSRRTQKAFGTAMRLCASLFRGVAAPLGCVILSLVFQHCVLLLSMWNSHTTQTDWYHHSRLVLHAVEPPTSGHQNGPLIVYCSVWQILY